MKKKDRKRITRLEVSLTAVQARLIALEATPETGLEAPPEAGCVAALYKPRRPDIVEGFRMTADLWEGATDQWPGWAQTARQKDVAEVESLYLASTRAFALREARPDGKAVVVVGEWGDWLTVNAAGRMKIYTAAAFAAIFEPA